MEHKGNVHSYCNRFAWNNYQSCKELEDLDKETRRLRNQRTSRDHEDYSTKISQNTEKSPGDLTRFAVTQPPVKDHQLTLV